MTREQIEAHEKEIDIAIEKIALALEEANATLHDSKVIFRYLDDHLLLKAIKTVD